MCEDNPYEDIEFITQTALVIREALLADSSYYDFITEMQTHRSENETYPDDIVLQMVPILEKIAPDQVTPFRGILLNEDCPENGVTLLDAVFYGCEGDFVPMSQPQDEDIIVDEPILAEVETVLTTDRVWETTLEESQRLADVLSVSPNVAFFLLQDRNWSEQDAAAAYAENPAARLAAIGLKSDQAMDPLNLRPKEDSDELEMCAICCDEVPKREILGLACGHCACKNTWKQCAMLGIQSGANRVPCVEYGCHCSLTLDDVMMLCGPEIADSYRNFIIDQKIAIDKQLVRCLNPRCNNVLTLNSVGLCHVATCSCGQRMCWKCREEAHAPLSCERVAEWRNIAQEEVLQAKWIVDNTKPCPKCKTRIEKNGGCNHMTCRTATGGGCGYEFCWICGHEWNTHEGNGYQCNKYVDFDTLDKSGVPQFDAKRMDHYHSRYRGHVRSQEIEREKRRVQRTLLVEGLSGQQRNARFRVSQEEAEEIATEVFHAIDTARSVLVWSYPHAFFMAPGSVDLSLFEHVQTEVERYLEHVTDLVENSPTRVPPNELRQQGRILAANTEVLNKHVDNYSH